MARVGINDELHADRRFKALVRELGDDQASEDRAIGMLYRFWRYAQDCWANGKLVPFNEFEQDGFLPILKCGLAIREGDEIQAIGSEKHFEWYRQRKVAGRKSAKARKQYAKDHKKDSNGIDTERERKGHGIGTEGTPISTSITISTATAITTADADAESRFTQQQLGNLNREFGEPLVREYLKHAVALWDTYDDFRKSQNPLIRSAHRFLLNQKEKLERAPKPGAGTPRDKIDLAAIIESREAGGTS